MPSDKGFVGPGPYAHPSLIIYGFIKQMNKPSTSVETRCNELSNIWSWIRVWPGVMPIENRTDGAKSKPGDPRYKLIELAFKEFRDEHDPRIEMEQNYFDDRADLQKTLDHIQNLMIEVVIEQGIISKIRMSGPISLDVDKEEVTA